TAEVAPWLASHEAVRALDLAGTAPLPGRQASVDWGELERAAASTLTRVMRPAGSAPSSVPAEEPDWTAPPAGPARILAFTETKTVWHPKGR
ncbi:MAG: aldehyde dehydrogenase family protein, partial [Solirubrobacteraceae bacterium]